MNVYQNDGWRKAHDLKHIICQTWRSMDASEDRLLEFIDDAIADSSNILNCGIYRAVLAAQIQSNPANRLAADSQCKWTMT